MADTSTIAEVLRGAQSVIILGSDTSDVDVVAAMAALASALTGMGKMVSAGGVYELTPDLLNIPGADQIKSKLGNQQLRVIFPYEPNQVDKVSYSIDSENGRFILVVQPKQGNFPLDYQSVGFDYAGVAAEVVVMIGVSDLSQVSKLIDVEGELLTSAATILATKTSYPTVTANLVMPDQWSYAQWASEIILQLQVEVSGDVATAILAGINHVSNAFQDPNTPASAFATTAQMLQLGGKRLPLRSGIIGGIPVMDGGSKIVGQSPSSLSQAIAKLNKARTQASEQNNIITDSEEVDLEDNGNKPTTTKRRRVNKKTPIIEQGEVIETDKSKKQKIEQHFSQVGVSRS